MLVRLKTSQSPKQRNFGTKAWVQPNKTKVSSTAGCHNIVDEVEDGQPIFPTERTGAILSIPGGREFLKLILSILVRQPERRPSLEALRRRFHTLPVVKKILGPSSESKRCEQATFNEMQKQLRRMESES
jgi:hypothetical protein